MRNGERDPGPGDRDASVESSTESSATDPPGRDGRGLGGFGGRFRPDDEGGGSFRLEPVPGFDPRALSATAGNAVDGAWDRYVHIDEARDAEPSRPGLESLLDDYEGSGNAAVLTTDGSPWSWVCQLVVHWRRGEPELATGWLASPRVVVTAGRAVYHPDRGWPEKVEVYPGMDGSLSPWGGAVASACSSVRGWTVDQDPESDYGCALLDPGSFQGIGHFGLAWDLAAGLAGQVLNTSGYPADRPRATQWFDAGRVSRVRRRSLKFIPGLANSVGSPIWLNRRIDGRVQRLVCAMTSQSGGRSRHLLFDGAMTETIEGWIARADADRPAGRSDGALEAAP